MLYFFIILSVLLAGTLVLLLYSFDVKIKAQRKKMNLVNNQYNQLRRITISEKSLFQNINLTYSKSIYNYGITSTNIKVFYLPIDGFKTVIDIKDPLELDILEQCINQNIVWFYVDLKLQNNINSRGWIKQSDFSILRDDYNPLQNNLLH
ncbi:MAG: hypothetical protein ACRDD2_07610 [Sarcina sp.]